VRDTHRFLIDIKRYRSCDGTFCIALNVVLGRYRDSGLSSSLRVVLSGTDHPEMRRTT